MLRVSRFARAAFRRSPALRAEAKPAAGGASQLNLLFATPQKVITNNKPVHMVTVPAETGVIGILADYQPTIAQLKPGVLTIHENTMEDAENYFVSGGFCVVREDSTASISVTEAVPIDDLDFEAAQAGLDQCRADLASAKDELARSEAQIGVDVFEAMTQAAGVVNK
mmetsp:Transcript_3909/g.4529  ORF Transcript_3909/g.4529 Transcript_3909/m.4529 type:complete len:168 (+) Transcript_3909:27-530(+)|eukprot:CAMPEP_0205822228 /NCGR_PEP_ID=MMETSP0206-20130828/11659_1 /ASSEMBLY_ACC=CAM_ASM_000279 /TAXON_ID=36767 /ORGANISM="Euplotes focardii, Strain TN1" /LENGTH=167 /DNA_ID=CAMNT_0053118333 /DNA_START=27 /DNA_END=530 /DNA_ORIENTATION=+